MEEIIKDKLQTNTLKRAGDSGSGCISQGAVYQTDNKKIFIKTNSSKGSDVMFNGEFEGLKTIRDTGVIKVPEPILTGSASRKHFIVMEYLDLHPVEKHSELGEKLAKLHLHNLTPDSGQIHNKTPKVDRFGFHVPTCCGSIPQNNDWCDDWLVFFTQKMEDQMKTLGDRTLNEKWAHLQLKIPTYFQNIEVRPSLLHGDLWSGNVGYTTEPAIYDPAAFYGHHEYDLAITEMFGKFHSDFYSSYHELIPKEDDFLRRSKLYQLFHHLNHWNHFGAGYRHSSLSIINDLVNC